MKKPARRQKQPDESKAEKPCCSPPDWLWAVALFAAVLLAYQPAWNGKPIWDDNVHLLPPALQSWAGLGQIWFQPGATQQYYPVVFSVFWAGHQLWGDAPAGYHLVNILLHGTSALLLMKVLRRLGVPGAWLGAALWALHPVQAESVAWMSELKNCLSAACYMGSVLAYLRYHREKEGKFYLAALGLFGAGMLSKSVIATMPAALLLMFWWKRKRLGWKEDVLPLGPFFAVGLGLGMMTAWIERTMIIGVEQGAHLSMVERWLIPGRAVWFYLGKLAWPHPLVFIYRRWEVDGAVWWQSLFPLAVLLLLAGLWQFRKALGMGPMVALLFFLGTLFPALGFFDVYPFRYSFVADHFQYLACVGPLVLAGVGLERGWGWIGMKAHGLKPLYCIVFLAIPGGLTWVQCGQYADVETLWRATLAGNPACWMAHDNLGTTLLREGNLAEAAGHFRQAIALKPDDEKACFNLGALLSRNGEVAEAVALFRKGLAVQPRDAKARDSLGTLLVQQGQVIEGIGQFRMALAFDPGLQPAREHLGLALLDREDYDGAMGCFEKLGVFPSDAAQKWSTLGNALSKAGHAAEAGLCYRRASGMRAGTGGGKPD